MSKTITVNLPLADSVELEVLLLALASYAEAESRTLDTLGLPLCAQNARAAVRRARGLSETLKAAGPSIRYARSA